MPTTVQLRLQTPHPAQAKIIHECKRFNVVCCGRRWGKTVLGMDRLIHPALKGKPVAWFAPNYRQLANAWRSGRVRMLALVNPLIESGGMAARREDSSGLAYAQEDAAAFVSWAGAVFRKILDAVSVAPPAGKAAVIGVDWGRTHDYTVLMV